MGAAARHTQNQELRDLLVFTAANGPSLSVKPERMNVSRNYFNESKSISHKRTMNGIKMIIQKTRRFYKSETEARSTPFLYVLNDIWSSKHLEILGVSVCFICPLTFSHALFGIGLVKCSSKKAVDVVRQINIFLKRIGVEPDDVLHSINDTTNLLVDCCVVTACQQTC